jgi:heme exporter protein C
MINYFLQLKNFDKNFRIFTPIFMLSSTTFLFFAILAIASSPNDYQQSNAVKIMYIHVPSAWIAVFAYVIMTSASLGVLVWKHPLADAAQKTAASLGAAFTFVCLITGSLWGKPMWGTYWVWDARLTSMLVLFLLYLGLIAIRRTLDDTPRGARIASIMTLVGAIDIPIIKYSVDWWNTLHQPASVFRADGPTISPSMLWPLLVMALATTLLFTTLHLMAIRNEILRRRLLRLSQLALENDLQEASALELAP